MRSYIKEYAAAINTGEVVVGWKIKAIVKHLIDSMEDERFVFDPTYAHKRMDFQEKYCLQGKAPYYGKPIELMLWQKAFWEGYYGFYMKDTGLRRFTEGHVEIGRKNGKTTMFAADANTDVFIGEGGIDICCASNDDRQAKFIWSETAGMQQRLDPKGELTKHNLVNIYNHRKNITIFRLSSKTQNKDGFNCKKFYLDECHDAEDDEIYDALKRSQSPHADKSALSCSTQGHIVDGFYDRFLKKCNEVIDDPESNIHLLPFLFEQDSENEVWSGNRENRLWEKSNPSLKYGVKKWEYLEEQIADARRDKASKIKMLCKDFNIKQNNAESWLMLDDVENEETFNIEEFRNGFYVAGADFSLTNDLTAIALIFMKPDSNKKYVHMRYFLPADKIKNSKDSGAEYKQWFDDGLIIKTNEFNNDPALIADWLYKLKREYNITPFKVGYDRWNADPFVRKMGSAEGYFYDDVLVPITQSKNILNAPIRQTEDELKAKNINYNNNPILKWNLLNCVLEVDNRDKCQLAKPKNQPYKKIDGAVALVMALHTLQQNREEFIRLINR